jgi:hypothetical protein
MLKTAHRHKKAVAQIVREYRILAGTSHKQATLRQFAESLSEVLSSLGRAVSYQSIKNWGDQRYLPDTLLMMRLSKARDWRGEFATDILAALYPEDYQPATEIGRRALHSSHEIQLSGGHNGNTSTAEGYNGHV